MDDVILREQLYSMEHTIQMDYPELVLNCVEQRLIKIIY